MGEGWETKRSNLHLAMPAQARYDEATLGVLMHEACPHLKKFFLRLHYSGAPFARVPDTLIREGSEPATK